MARLFGFKVAAVVAFGVLLLVGVLLLPFLLIWSLNTLFDLGIPFNLWTWLAAVVLWLFLLSTRGLALAREIRA